MNDTTSAAPSDAEIEKLAAEHLKAFAQFSGAGDVWVEGEVAFARAALAKWGTPQQEAQDPGEIPAFIERMATGRYKVVPSHESMFHRWAVVAGSGTQQLYLGSEVECQNMARKFAGAFLDGAFVTMQSTSPNPAPAPLSDDTKRLDWLDRNIFSREMSEWDAKYGHGPDYNMWVVFSPKGVQGSARNIIDAAIAAQGGK